MRASSIKAARKLSRMDAIDELLNGIDSLPPAPGVLPRLLAALGDDNTDLSEVTDMIAVDPALTAKLLQTCNSAFFGRATAANDVTEALHRMGFRNVYRIVAVVSGMHCLRLSRANIIDIAQLWKHLVTTAFAGQFVAEDIGVDGGLLFTAGLLHDIGKLIMAEVFKTQYVRFISDARSLPQPVLEEERRRFNMDHAGVGARLLERWNFSPALVASVQFHHEPAAAGDQQRLGACMQLADSLAHSVEPIAPRQLLSAQQLEAALTLCALAPEDLSRYQDRIRENVAFVESMCRLRG
jgi:putative nucleotidyltransferase with HDIG domain